MANFRHVRRGQPITRAITAEEWNWLMDLRRRQGGAGVGINNVNDSDWPYYHRVRVRNVTGADLELHQIVGLGDIELLPAVDLTSFRRTPIFAGETPAQADHWRKWAVLITEIKDGELGWAAISGVVAVKVNVIHAAHDRVAPGEGIAANLISGFAGTGRILGKEAGTGVKWAWVEFHREESRTIKGVLDAALPVDDFAEMSVWINGLDSGANELVALNWAHGGQLISAGKQIMARWYPDELNWVVFVAECED